MKTGDRRKVTDKATLDAILFLIENGHTNANIAQQVGLHRSSINYYRRKYAIETELKNLLPETTPEKKKIDFTINESGDKICQGHTYREYLILEKRRKRNETLSTP